MSRLSTVGWMLTFLLACGLRAGAQDAKEPPPELMDMSLEALMDMEITTASKKAERLSDAPGVVSVMTKEEIRTFGVRTLRDVLTRMPGMYTIGSYLWPGNVASTRGDMLSHVDNHTLVLINGRPVRESINGGLNYSVYLTYPVEMIERVEVIRGPGSVLYGTNAYTGVVNVITKRGDESELTVASEAGSYGYYSTRVSGGTADGDLRVYGAVQQIHRDGWSISAVDEAAISGSMSNRHSSGSFASHIEYGDLTCDVFWSSQEDNHFGVSPLWSRPGNELDTERLFVDLGYTMDLGEKWQLVPHVGLNYMHVTFQDGEQDRRPLDGLAEVMLFGQPTEKLNVVGGFVAEHQAAPETRRSSIQQYSRVPVGAYAQADYQVLEPLKVFAGLQWNKPEDGHSDTITRFGTIFEINPQWGIKLLRGEAFRAPWPVETSISIPVLAGNPDLEPEMITTYDAQLFYHGQDSRASLTYFYSTMEDLITRVPASGGGFTFANGGDMDFWGLELEGRKNLTPELYALGSITYQESSEDAGINPSVAPHTMGKLGLGYEQGRLSAGLFYTYFSTPPSISGAAEVNPDPTDMHWVSLNMEYDVTDWLDLKKGSASVTFRVENLLDDEIHRPEFTRGVINSLPEDSGLRLLF